MDVGVYAVESIHFDVCMYSSLAQCQYNTTSDCWLAAPGVCVITTSTTATKIQSLRLSVDQHTLAIFDNIECDPRLPWLADIPIVHPLTCNLLASTNYYFSVSPLTHHFMYMREG